MNNCNSNNNKNQNYNLGGNDTAATANNVHYPIGILVTY
jgi:hypothetical protein